jgi:hypothetical protein
VTRHACAQVEVDALGAIEKDPQGWGAPAADQLDGQYLDVGLERAQALLDLRLNSGRIVSPQLLLL